jgi:4a-hydroxytetrahydrobiopterin dehydratase
MMLVGVECKLKNHHPELRNVRFLFSSALMFVLDKFIPSLQNYKAVYYRWTTHVPRGLSAKDTHMALFCDDKAKYLGLVDTS